MFSLVVLRTSRPPVTWDASVETSARNMPGSVTSCQVWTRNYKALKILLYQQFMTFILDGIMPPEPVLNHLLDNVVQILLLSVK